MSVSTEVPSWSKAPGLTCGHLRTGDPPSPHPGLLFLPGSHLPSTGCCGIHTERGTQTAGGGLLTRWDGRRKSGLTGPFDSVWSSMQQLGLRGQAPEAEGPLVAGPSSSSQSSGQHRSVSLPDGSSGAVLPQGRQSHALLPGARGSGLGDTRSSPSPSTPAHGPLLHPRASCKVHGLGPEPSSQSRILRLY